MSVLTVILLMYLPAPVQPIQWELNSLELSFRTGYYGSRYTTQLLPELRANGCLHDLEHDLELEFGWPISVAHFTLYPHGGIRARLLGFLSPGYSNWEIGLGDADFGLEAFINKKLSLNFNILIPAGSYYDRLGEGHWSASAGIGYLFRARLPLQVDLLWQGVNPDGVDLGNGTILAAGYLVPKGWFLSSSLAAFLPDRSGPFDFNDRTSIDWSAKVEKQYRFGQDWSVSLCLEQTLWGLDTQVWTTFEVRLRRASE